MKNEQLKIIVESLIDIAEKAGKKTIELYNSGLKIISASNLSDAAKKIVQAIK